jgi:hypothetical protein
MLIGSAMTVSSGDGYIAAFTFVVGAGAGLGLATAASAAMVEISAERSGVGGALIQAIIKLGPAFGATILGSVLNSTYQGQVAVAGLPAEAAAAVQQSVFGGIAVARQLGSPALLGSVQTAFVAGTDDAARVAALVAAAAAVVALLVMPRRVAAPTETPDQVDQAEAPGPSSGPVVVGG